MLVYKVEVARNCPKYGEIKEFSKLCMESALPRVREEAKAVALTIAPEDMWSPSTVFCTNFFILDGDKLVEYVWTEKPVEVEE